MPDIYFVTNRNLDDHAAGGFGTRFSNADIDDLRFGKARLTRRDGRFRLRSATLLPEKLDPDPARAELGSTVVFAELRRAMERGADTLAFIHGYNVSFENALISGAMLRERYASTERKLNVVVFSWPSDGSMLPLLAYKRDRSDARASGPALARLMFRLRDLLYSIRRGEECGGKIHLMAHSMGNYVLRNALQDLRRGVGGALPRLFDELFLFAADEDDDAFEYDHKLRPLPGIADSVHVYFNRGDAALVVSDRTKSNPARLGARGPRLPLGVPGNVSLVDCSEVLGGLVEHDYYLSNPKVRRDVGRVLDGMPPDRIGQRRYVAAQNRYVLG